MSHPDRLSALVFEASNLRDYLLHVQGLDGDILGRALAPFERSGTDTSPSEKEAQTLRQAFQTSYDLVSGRVDAYTIGEVLKGRSPLKKSPPIATSVVLTVFGFALVVLAFQYTYWANRATIAVAQAEKFVAYDHFPRLSRLMEMKYYFDQVSDQADVDGLEPQLLYLEGVSSLQSHYLEEETLPIEIDSLLSAAGDSSTFWAATHSQFCPTSEGDDRIVAAIRFLLNCPEPETPVDLEANLADPTQAFLAPADFELAAVEDIKFVPNRTASNFEQRFELAKGMQEETMRDANRSSINFYQDSRHYVRGRINELRERLNAVHLWWLPIIYGALGSIVYCMWRVLNPNVAPLGFLYSTMRTIFAGLAALTLSMLLVPSNLLTAGVELNRPLIYLLSFIFGYSVEVFINTLNLLHSYFLSSLSAKPRSTQK